MPWLNLSNVRPESWLTPRRTGYIGREGGHWVSWWSPSPSPSPSSAISPQRGTWPSPPPSGGNKDRVEQAGRAVLIPTSQTATILLLGYQCSPGASICQNYEEMRITYNNRVVKENRQIDKDVHLRWRFCFLETLSKIIIMLLNGKIPTIPDTSDTYFSILPCILFSFSRFLKWQNSNSPKCCLLIFVDLRCSHNQNHLTSIPPTSLWSQLWFLCISGRLRPLSG